MTPPYAPITQAFFDHVAEHRRQGTPDAEIATTLGITRAQLHGKISCWNQRCPDNKVPRPFSRPTEPLYVAVARLTREGRSRLEIAGLLRRSPRSIIEAIYVARERGLLPPTSAIARDGPETYRHYLSKGAAPPRGAIGTVLEHLTKEEVETLLRRTDPQEPTLAHTIARLLKERLNEPC